MRKIFAILIFALLSTNVYSAFFRSALIFEGSSKSVAAYSQRFVKIADLKKNFSSSIPYALKLQKECYVFSNNSLVLSMGNPNFHSMEWGEYEQHWFPFLCRACSPFALTRLHKFPFYQISEDEQPRRGLRKSQILFPHFVMKSFKSEDIEEWIEEYKNSVEAYSTGTSSVPQFHIDLLKRKIEASISNAQLKSGECQNSFDASAGPDSKYFTSYSIEELGQYFFDVDRLKGGKHTREYSFHPVPNGLAITAVFHRGVFHSCQAHTYDGSTIDVTSLARSIDTLPKIIKKDKDLKISGYLYLDNSSLEELNCERIRNGKSIWVDSASAIMSAVINSKEPHRTLELKLKCIFDEINVDDDKFYMNHPETREELKRLGLPVTDKIFVRPWDRACSIIDSFWGQEFDICGVKIRDAGESVLKKYRPKDAFYKIAPKLLKAKIDSIKFQLLENGHIASVVYAHDLDLKKEGYRFTFGNVTDFRNMNLQIGDTISVIEPQGGRSPYIHFSFANGGDVAQDFVRRCPTCNGALLFREWNYKQVAMCCAHLYCKEDTIEDILHFTSSSGLYVPSLTKSIVEDFKKKFKAFSPADIFALKEGDFMSLSNNINRDVFDRILSEIEIAKNTTLSKLLYALNISPNIDPFTADKLASYFGTIDAIMQASVEDFKKVTPLASDVSTYFSNQVNRNKVYKIFENGVNLPIPDPEVHRLCKLAPENVNQSDYLQVVSRVSDVEKHTTISDLEYDTLYSLAKQIEKKNPGWKRTESLSNASAVSRVQDPFSLKKTYDINAIPSLCEDQKIEGSYYIEPKVNGVACLLKYNGGVLEQAYTKNDSAFGNDITEYIKLCSRVPKRINKNFSGVIRGELYFTRDSLSLINKTRENEGLDSYVDGLSAIVATINMKRLSNTAIFSMVDYYPYDIIFDNWSDLRNRTQLSQYFENLGFKSGLLKKARIINGVDDLITFIKDVESLNKDYDVDIDGIVIKDHNKFSLISVAYKINQEVLHSNIKNIAFSLGSNGRLSAIVFVRPVAFSNGRTISRIYVPDISKLIGAYDGVEVAVRYASGSAPMFDGIQDRKKTNQDKPICIPDTCPICSSKLERLGKGVWCKNIRCSRKSKHQSLLAFAKDVKIISGGGDKNFIMELINAGIISSFADFYRLIPEEIIHRTSMTLEEAKMVINSIEKSAVYTPVSKFLCALRIAHISQRTYQQILSKLDSSKQLLNLGIADLAEYTARKNAHKLVEYLKQNKEDLLCYFEKHEKNKLASLVSPDIPTETVVGQIRADQRVISDLLYSITRVIKKTEVDLGQLHIMLSSDDESTKYAPWKAYVSKLLKEEKKALVYLEKYQNKINSIELPSVQNRAPKKRKLDNEEHDFYFDEDHYEGEYIPRDDGSF